MSSIRPSGAKRQSEDTQSPSPSRISRTPEEIAKRVAIREAAAKDLGAQLLLPVDPRVKAFLEKMATDNDKKAENNK